MSCRFLAAATVPGMTPLVHRWALSGQLIGWNMNDSVDFNGITDGDKNKTPGRVSRYVTITWMVDFILWNSLKHDGVSWLHFFKNKNIYSFPPSRLLTSSCFNFNETSILKIQVRAQSIRCNTFWVVAYWDQALTGLDPWFFEVRLLKHPLWVASVPPSQHLFQGNNAEIRAVLFEFWMVNSLPIGSMYAIYGNIYHQSTPVMLAYIAAPWIRHGLGNSADPSRNPWLTPQQRRCFPWTAVMPTSSRWFAGPRVRRWNCWEVAVD